MLRTLRHLRDWRRIEIFDTVTSLAERFGLDKAETWFFLKIGVTVVFGLGGWLTQGLFVGLALALAVYVMLWIAQREQARGAAPGADLAPIAGQPAPSAPAGADRQPLSAHENSVAALEIRLDGLQAQLSRFETLVFRMLRARDTEQILKRLDNEAIVQAGVADGVARIKEAD